MSNTSKTAKAQAIKIQLYRSNENNTNDRLTIEPGLQKT